MASGKQFFNIAHDIGLEIRCYWIQIVTVIDFIILHVCVDLNISTADTKCIVCWSRVDNSGYKMFLSTVLKKNETLKIVGRYVFRLKYFCQYSVEYNVISLHTDLHA